MWPLRQSTASQEIPLGEFVDSTDGVTAETGLTIANTDIKLFKAGATSEANKNSGGATHIASGRYYAVLDATDTNTLGPMRISVHVAGALPIKLDCIVYPTAVYDQMFAGTEGFAQLAVDVDAGFQAQTDLLNNLVGADATLATATKESIADTVLARNVAGGGNGGKTVTKALAMNAHKWVISSTTLTVYAADGTTPLWTGTVTKDADGAIIAVTPA